MLEDTTFSGLSNVLCLATFFATLSIWALICVLISFRSNFAFLLIPCRYTEIMQASDVHGLVLRLLKNHPARRLLSDCVKASPSEPPSTAAAAAAASSDAASSAEGSTAGTGGSPGRRSRAEKDVMFAPPEGAGGPTSGGKGGKGGAPMGLMAAIAARGKAKEQEQEQGGSEPAATEEGPAPKPAAPVGLMAAIAARGKVKEAAEEESSTAPPAPSSPSGLLAAIAGRGKGAGKGGGGLGGGLMAAIAGRGGGGNKAAGLTLKGAGTMVAASAAKSCSVLRRKVEKEFTKAQAELTASRSRGAKVCI